MTDPSERLRLTTTARELSVPLTQGTEKRLRMWIDRYNRASEREPGFHPDDLIDPDSDGAMGVAIAICLTEALTADEQDYGLHCFEWGECVSADVADEMFRRGEW